MSLLTATHEELQPQGRLLPEGTYRATVEEASIEKTANGTRLSRRCGNVRGRNGEAELALPDGSTFRIGNRKLFARSWIDHTNADAARIGNREIKKEAVSAGLMPKPEKGGSSDLNFPGWPEYAQALVGRDVLVRVKHEQRMEQVQAPNGTMVKQPAKDADGNPIVDVRIADWLTE